MKKNFNIPLNHSRNSIANEAPKLSKSPESFNNFVYSSLTDRARSNINSTERLTASPFHVSNHQIKRPISLTVLEKYFSDVCQSINSKNCIDLNLLNRVETMKDVLQDCLNAVNDLSLEIYILMSSAIKDLQHFQAMNDRRIFSGLISKLIQINMLIEDDKFTSKTEPAVQGWGQIGKEGEDLETELDIRISRITARILNVWKKIVSPQKEAGIICCCFLLLYCEVDRTIKVSPVVRVKFDKAVNLMKDYSANPGYVVTVIRRTKEFIENERISLEVVRRIHESMVKISSDSVKDMDKTFTGFALYELILYSIRYYQQCYLKKHGIDALDKDYFDGKSKDTKLSDRSLNLSHSEIFTNALSVESPQKSPIKLGTKPKTSVRSLHRPFTKTFSQSPEKSITARSSLKPSPAKPKPGETKASIVSKSPIRTIKSGLVPQESEKKIIKPAVRPTFFKSRGKEKMETSASSSPARPQKTLIGGTADSIDQSQIVEELQYQQFIEDKFRSFLIGKLENEGKVEAAENAEQIEEKVILNREKWKKEFENSVGVIRINALKKLGDDKRFSTELLRAQKQLEMIEISMKSK